MKTWQDKVHQTIHALCTQEYLRANQLSNGQLRKCHAPYSVPAEASELCDCLKHNDEHRAKSIMMYNYRISKL